MGLLCVGFLPAADSVAPDTSGDSLLTGKYWVRQVIYTLNSKGGPATAFGISGAITFDGKGKYSFTGQEADTITGKVSPLSRNATYRVGVTGIASLDSLIFPINSTNEIVYGGVGANGIFTGSATEGNNNDMFIAIPAGTSSATSSLSGNFWIGHMDQPGGNPAKARNSLFKVNADGKGGLGPVSLIGRDQAQPASTSGKPLSFTVAAPSYTILSDGTGTITFPPPAGVTASGALFGGTKTLYVSADGNYVLGGDPAGYDIFFGFRPLTATTQAATSAAYFGVYYYSSVDTDASDPTNVYFVSENGSINAFQNLKEFWHQRTSPFNDYSYDFNYDSDNHTVSSDGTYSNSYYQTIVSGDGQAVMIVGASTDFTLLVAVHAPSVPTSSVFLNPLGILNAASFAPVTTPISPGELITLFGSNLANTTAVVQAPPFANSLGGVQVLINDRPSAVYAVSATQVSAIVPYATSGSYAKIQVINNGKASNIVTLYLRDCSPGVFAIPATGSGAGAILHANYQLVTSANPAKQGEVILIYLTGLGLVKPSVPDGAAGPVSPLSYTISDVTTFFGGDAGVTQYQGLAPGLAGLYQLNVQIPKDAPIGGQIQLDVKGNLCESAQIRIPIVAGP